MKATYEHATLPDRQDASGGVMALRCWRAEDKPSLVFTHATGMCASAYQQFLSPLSQSFNIVAPDLRGHGLTQLPATPERLRNWSVYAKDLESYLLQQAQPEKGWRLMGHSMGAVTGLLVAAAGTVKVSHLILIEPVIVPAVVRWVAMLPVRQQLRQYYPIARQAAKRRAVWPDYDTVLRGYGRKGFFKSWADGVLENYLEDGLTKTDDGVTLSCNPAWEAATFAAQGQNVWQAFARLKASGTTSVHIILAERESTAPEAARARLDQREVPSMMIPDSGHLIPQEQPEQLAEIVRQLLAGQIQ